MMSGVLGAPGNVSKPDLLFELSSLFRVFSSAADTEVTVSARVKVITNIRSIFIFAPWLLALLVKAKRHFCPRLTRSSNHRRGAFDEPDYLFEKLG
jgi:hypothetical protein